MHWFTRQRVLIGASVVVVLAIIGVVVALATNRNPAKPAASSPTTTTTTTTPTPSAKPKPKPTCPLTGLAPTKGENRNRVALAVKIDNVDLARPQSGIDHADVVIEETVEGGLTRLMAIFQCDSAATVGPIRSTRTSDGDLLRLLDGAVFGFSGANPRVLPGVARASKAVLISYDSLPQYYHREFSRPAPHNVYSSTATILGAGLSRHKGLHAPKPLFSYGAPKHSGHPAHHVLLTWPAASAEWTWSGHTWLRTQNGSPDVTTGGKRLNAANVVIMSIQTKASGFHDVLGNSSPDDVVTGHGQVWVLRDGRVIHGTWSRPKASDGMVLKDGRGSPLLLHPGKTWIELLPQPRRPQLS